MESATFTADTTTNMPNPERGHYLRSGVQPMADPAGFNTEGGYVYDGQVVSGVTIPPARLMHFNQDLPLDGSPITSQDLIDLGTSFGYARTRGLKLIPRFRYGETGVEPSLPSVINHTVQLGPVLAANRDVLFLVEAGFIGPWGEWADSPSGLDTKQAKRDVKNAVLAMVPPEIPVCFTQIYPPQEDWFSGQPALSEAEAFNGSDKARIGFHSDCIFKNNGDAFFYTGPTTVNDFVVTKSRYEQRRYVMAWDRAPFTGEICSSATGMRTDGTGSVIPISEGGASPNGDPGGVLNEGPAYHFSSLNRFPAALWDAWIAEGATVNTVYRQLGYRFQYDSLTHASSVARGATLLVTVNMRNVGWSRLFSERRLMVRLVNGGTVIAGYSSAQLRQLPQQASASTKVLIPVPIPSGAATGSYAMSLEMPDIYSSIASRRAYKIQPANADSGGQAWDDTNGRFATGTSVTVT